MPNKRDIPDDLKDNLPKGAQDIYREALNAAYDNYQDPNKRRGSADVEETANKVAWSAVKKKYSKGKDGKWHRKTT